MDILEMVRTKVKELTDPNGPASEMLHSAKHAVAHGLEGAGKFVDERTHGKYSSTITNSVGKAKEFLGEQPKDEAGADAKDGADAAAAADETGTEKTDTDKTATGDATTDATATSKASADAPRQKGSAKPKPPTAEPQQSAPDEPPRTENPPTY